MTAINESFLDSPGADECHPSFITLSTSDTDEAVQALDANPYA